MSTYSSVLPLKPFCNSLMLDRNKHLISELLNIIFIIKVSKLYLYRTLTFFLCSFGLIHIPPLPPYPPTYKSPHETLQSLPMLSQHITHVLLFLCEYSFKTDEKVEAPVVSLTHPQPPIYFFLNTFSRLSTKTLQKSLLEAAVACPEVTACEHHPSTSCVSTTFKIR